MHMHESHEHTYMHKCTQVYTMEEDKAFYYKDFSVQSCEFVGSREGMWEAVVGFQELGDSVQFQKPEESRPRKSIFSARMKK